MSRRQTIQRTRLPRHYRGWIWFWPRWEAVAVVMIAVILFKAWLDYAVIFAFIREFRHVRHLRATDPTAHAEWQRTWWKFWR
jgi:hypothetical protein